MQNFQNINNSIVSLLCENDNFVFLIGFNGNVSILDKKTLSFITSIKTKGISP